MDDLKYELEDTKKLLQFANEERAKYAEDVKNLRANAEANRYQVQDCIMYKLLCMDYMIFVWFRWSC
jgi:hypothetical protein